MDIPSSIPSPSPKKFIKYVPITVLVFAALTWYFAETGAGYEYVRPDLTTVFNPLLYVAGLFFHINMAHYWGNMRLFIPLGIVLTWLTSNRHVLGVIFISHLLGTIARVGIALSVGIISVGVGSSIAVFGVIAATLVRATGEATRNVSIEVVQTLVFSVMCLSVLALLLLALSAGNTQVDHLGHALGFMFGGSFESLYVFSEHEKENKNDRGKYEFVHERR